MNNYKFILATILILPQGVSYASQNQADGPQIKVIGVESKEKDSILPDPTPRKVEISGMSRYDCVYEYKINVGGRRDLCYHSADRGTAFQIHRLYLIST